ncbi:MAG: acetoin utilization protein AcuB [Polaribacter sp.]|jgi:acetoin utilization protein AcuB
MLIVFRKLKDRAYLNKKVHHTVSRKPITLKKGANIYEAISVFNSTKISCIPVVNEKFQPIGIISWRDILKNWS